MYYMEITPSVFQQLVVVAYDHGEPVKESTTLVEITVLQPSVIPVFTQEEYRYALTHTNTHQVCVFFCI